MTDGLIPAVAYAAKSTDDMHGSIPTQLADARTLAERDSLQIVAEFQDEAKSAYKGSRGPGLARAVAECERLAIENGEAALVVQHSDRLARGDGRKAKHLVEYALWAIKAGVTIRSVQDPQTFGDLLHTVVAGQRNHEDSSRKSASTRDGLKRRKERGQPVGPIPLGYCLKDPNAKLTERVVDSSTAPVVDRIFDLADSGATPGEVARTLNAAGMSGKRGTPWVSRTVRKIIENTAYKGEKGYPALIDPERWQRVQENRQRLDPAAVQRRRGGRPPADDAYILRGVTFCAQCGGTLYTRRQAIGRVYVCRNRRQCTSLCDAPPIPAESLSLEGVVGVVGAQRHPARHAQQRGAMMSQQRRHPRLGIGRHQPACACVLHLSRASIDNPLSVTGEAALALLPSLKRHSSATSRPRERNSACRTPAMSRAGRN